MNISLHDVKDFVISDTHRLSNCFTRTVVLTGQ